MLGARLRDALNFFGFLGNNNVEIGGIGEGEVRSKVVPTKSPVVSISGRHNPLDLLDRDGWIAILNQLGSDPRDILNIREASAVFENILELECSKIDGRGSGKEACQLEEILPLILKWLDDNSICALRLLCKRTRDVVDKVLDESKSITPYENNGIFPRLIPPSTLKYPQEMSHEWKYIRAKIFGGPFLDSVESIEKLEIYLAEALRSKTKGSHPIIRKKVHVDVPLGHQLLDMNAEVDWPEIHDFLDRTFRLFTHFPENIAHLVIMRWSVRDSAFGYVYNQFQNLMGLLSNLQHLNIHLVEDWRHPPPEPEVVQLPALLPLPPCPKLESLRIHGYRMPKIFVREVARSYGSHLKKLDLELTANPTVRNIDVLELEQVLEETRRQSYDFPALNYLNLEVRSCPGSPVFKTVAPNLKRLILSLDGYSEEENYDHTLMTEDLINVFLQFPSALSITLCYSDIYMTSYESPLMELDHFNGRHENLKHLELRYNPFGSNLPLRFFTKLCPNVEVIDVRNHTRDLPTDEDFMLLRDKRFHESQIWSEHQSLKKASYLYTFVVERDRVPCYVCLKPENVIDLMPSWSLFGFNFY